MFALPEVRLGRVNYKPLLPSGGSFNAEKVLKSLKREILKRIKQKIMQEPFSARAKQALMSGMRIDVGPNSLTVTAIHPAFRLFIQGRQPRQMTWLTKARVPIPIVLDDGSVIFRTASAKSMANGGWYHPGRPGATFIDRAKAEAREVIRERLKKELAKQIRDTLMKSRRR